MYFISVFILSLLLAYPLGHYLADVMQTKPMKSDSFFKWIEQPIYAVLNVKQMGMNWRQYLGAFVLSNILLLVASVTILMTQFRASATVLSIANDGDRWLAIFVANYGTCFIGRHVKGFIPAITSSGRFRSKELEPY